MGRTIENYVFGVNYELDTRVFRYTWKVGYNGKEGKRTRKRWKIENVSG